MARWSPWLLLFVLLTALALRLPHLSERPLHNDEAVNGIKFRTLWQGGGYRYDPHEYHGPALPYATFATSWIRHLANRSVEPDETTLRLVPLLFGLGLVLLPLLTASALGRAGSLAAAGLTALSPSMVYFSRYYIHELLLVFFTGVLLAAGWHYTRTRRAAWALLAGAALGLMHASKETFVIALAALAAAAIATFLWTRWHDRMDWTPWRGMRAAHVIAGAAVAALISSLLFTSFFTNPSGLMDSLRAYLPWLDRAGGSSPHIRPWYFYLERLLWFHYPRGPVWSELLIFLLALVGFVAALRRRTLHESHAGFARFLGFYAFALASAYSLIGYKTPWCALGFWQPMILLAGLGVVVILQACRRSATRFAAASLILAGSAHLGYQAWQLSQDYSWRRQNPWVFAHTSADLLTLVQRVRDLASLHPQGRSLVVKIISPDDDYWPLPWYLRDFNHVGYYPAMPADPWAPIVISSVQFDASLETRPERSHLMAGLYELRPQPRGTPPTTFELYVALDLWTAYLKTHPPKPDVD